jgi:hypothetical protein
MKILYLQSVLNWIDLRDDDYYLQLLMCIKSIVDAIIATIIRYNSIYAGD